MHRTKICWRGRGSAEAGTIVNWTSHPFDAIFLQSLAHDGPSLMPSLAFDHLSTEERLTLIGELWDSLDAAALPVTDAQKAELDRRLATLADDIARGRDAETIIAEFDRRYQ
jgi:putative addiction module component (TIGR02574 family)